MADFVDRGAFLDGINKSVKDHRVPYNLPRSLENFSLEDGRAKRRNGRSVYAGKFTGSQIAKHGASSIDAARRSIDGRSTQYAVTPMSYGLLKWHRDFQPAADADWTVEFCLTLGSAEPVLYNKTARLSRNEYGGAPAILRAGEQDTSGIGGVVYDQSVVVNHVKIDRSPAPEIDSDPTDSLKTSDTFSLSSLCISYRADTFKLSFDVWNEETEIYKQVLLLSGDYGYAPGKLVHVTVTNAGPDRTLNFLLDGGIVASYEFEDGEMMAGEGDGINGGFYQVKRDIVLLNEFTARGAMASTCKILQDDGSEVTDMHESIFAYDPFEEELFPFEPNFMCASPPSGTAMSELRFWSKWMPGSEVESKLNRRLTKEEMTSDLKGYWRLDEGGPVCTETLRPGSSENARQITLHHGNPAYVSDPQLSGGFGISMADGQNLSKTYVAGRQDLEDSYVALQTCLDTENVPQFYSAEKDFTISMEIRTPHDFGNENNYRDADDDLTDVWGAIGTGDADQGETGRKAFTQYGLVDGAIVIPDVGDSFSFILSATGQPEAGLFLRQHRAFDQTLWCIDAEAKEFTNEEIALTNIFDSSRFALARGLITPSGRVAFEFFGRSHESGEAAREYRLVSRTVMETNTVYELVFRKRTQNRFVSAEDQSFGVGFRLEIIMTKKGGSLPSSEVEFADNSVGIGGRYDGDPVDIPAASTGDSQLTSGTMIAGPVRTVSIGASYTEDNSDRSLHFDPSPNAQAYFNVYSQRYLSPYQDQPGYFVLGNFRMWTRALSDREVRSVVTGARDVPNNSLLYNIYIDRPGSERVVSRSAYNTIFKMGHKSWGEIRSHMQQNHYDGVAEIRCGYFNSDRIGWLPLNQDFDNDRDAKCQGLMDFSSTLERRYGIFSVFDGCPQFDDSVSGIFRSIKSQVSGLLNDFSVGGIWRGTTIGDRTVLTSSSGAPKTWDGRNLTPLGFREWRGGLPAIAWNSGLGNGTIADEWYGFRLAYVAESQAIIDFSPQVAVRGSGGVDGHFEISNVSPHPDPRVTSTVLYMTKGSAPPLTREEALETPLLFRYEFPLDNSFHRRWDITRDPVGGLLDVTRTPFPTVQYSASAFSRLYLSGDMTIPDIIYFSEPGNPESIDLTKNRLVLEEGSGDAIVALRSSFGSLWAFKPGAIWRIQDTGQVIDGVAIHSQQKISPIGPTADTAITEVTFPDDGRVAFVFWSRHGPYIFDGTSTRPIGYPVEGEEAFDQIDPSTVFIIHNIESRELVFCYSEVDGCCSDRCRNPDRALVYNYRANTWHEETGIVGTVSLSADISIDTSSRISETPFGVGNASASQDIRYLPLVGTKDGLIVLWNDGDLDGVPASVETTEGLVRTYDSDTATFYLDNYPVNFNDPDGPQEGDEISLEPSILRGLWVTIYKEDRTDWFISPIDDNGRDWIRFGRACKIKFDPSPNDFFYIGRPPATVEFPWDNLDQPAFEKQIHRMRLWGKGDFEFRKAEDWNELTSTRWRKTPEARGNRLNIEVKANSEVIKLWLSTVSLDAELNSYGFDVEYRKDGNKPQR